MELSKKKYSLFTLASRIRQDEDYEYYEVEDDDEAIIEVNDDIEVKPKVEEVRDAMELLLNFSILFHNDNEYLKKLAMTYSETLDAELTKVSKSQSKITSFFHNSQ